MITHGHVHLRDAHKTPQFWLTWVVLCLNVSAGIGVIAATLVAAGIALAYFAGAGSNFPVALFGATLLIAALGFADDAALITAVLAWRVVLS